LLAEAWERLERERIEAITAGHSQGAQRSRIGEGVGVVHPSAPRSQPSGEAGNPVAETILRQFQTLCGDVRRTANVRCSPR
jgi:hypothetical protein